MTELVLALAADYGVPLLFAVTFLSCLALPVPSSLLMLASGGFAAAGDMVLPVVMLAAFAGAVLGDNLGYWLAHRFSGQLAQWLGANSNRAQLRQRAADYMYGYGGLSVLFSRWLVAPLGPYVNYAAGLAGFSWARFALWGAAGEVVWVTNLRRSRISLCGQYQRDCIASGEPLRLSGGAGCGSEPDHLAAERQ